MSPPRASRSPRRVPRRAADLKLTFPPRRGARPRPRSETFQQPPRNARARPFRDAEATRPGERRVELSRCRPERREPGEGTRLSRRPRRRRTSSPRRRARPRRWCPRKPLARRLAEMPQSRRRCRRRQRRTRPRRGTRERFSRRSSRTSTLNVRDETPRASSPRVVSSRTRRRRIARDVPAASRRFLEPQQPQQLLNLISLDSPRPARPTPNPSQWRYDARPCGRSRRRARRRCARR